MEFYDEVGVIGDVMQNHMTEMLSLVAMELPPDSGNIKTLLQNKVRLLRDVRRPTRDMVLTGQYATYNPELLRERGNKSKSFGMSVTPTFAAVLLYVDNWRWHGVPFLLVSGKKLDEKTSYVRVRFRNGQFCSSAALLSDDRRSCTANNQIVFNVGNDASRSRIAVSRGLPKPELPRAGWSRLTAVAASEESAVFGQDAAEMVHFVASRESEPYVELTGAALDGSRHLFVPADSVIAAWNIWSPVVDEVASVLPRQYLGLGKDSSRLDFFVARDGVLRYWVDERNVELHRTDKLSSSSLPEPGRVPSTFRNATLVVDTEDVIAAGLAELIVERAHEKVAAGLYFHLALSGGRTPKKLFRTLSRSSMPWKQTHVWMVDERCDGSNFEMIELNLLREARSISVANVHPMLPDFGDEPCGKESAYRRDEMYENAIRRLVANASFDFVVLGVGEDGHTASLFPGETALTERERLVMFTNASKTESHSALADMRLTLTLAAINSAHNVAVLVTGAAKYAVLRVIRELGNDRVIEYPVVGVEPRSGVLTWFVDHHALFGPDSV